MASRYEGTRQIEVACSTCAFFYELEPSQCRAEPPAINWPKVKKYDWCGRWMDPKGVTFKEAYQKGFEIVHSRQPGKGEGKGFGSKARR